MPADMLRPWRGSRGYRRNRPRCEVYFFIGLAQYRLQRVDEAIAEPGQLAWL